MDKYGCIRNTQEDWDGIFEILLKRGTVTFSYCADNYTAFVLTIAGPLFQVGVMPFGGQINNSFLVAIRMRGAEYFNLYANTALHADYVAQGLGITNDSDAGVIAELLNELRTRFDALRNKT